MQMILFLVIILKITVNKTFFKFLSEVLWHPSEKVLLKWCFLHIVDNQGMFIGSVISHGVPEMGGYKHVGSKSSFCGQDLDD